MKRILTSIAFVLCALAGHAQYSGSGSGTESDPYLIFNETQLSQMANFLGQEGVVFRLMKNLDLTNWIAENSPSQGWLPIGVESSPFKGVLLGEGHTISGLSITRPNTDNVGFFGYLDGATISNLTIEGTNITGADYTGGFVGNSVNSSLSNCHISLSGQVTCVNYSGGFAGRLTDGSSISNCSVGTKITSSGNNVGGFAGKAINSTIANVNQSGDVTASQGTTDLVSYSTESMNLDFAQSTPLTVDIRTYAKDIVGDNVAHLQPVEGWAISENGDGRAGAVYAYGSSNFLGGQGYIAPTADPNGNTEGNALGLVATWTATAQYTKRVILQPGNYVLTVPVYNSKGGSSVPVKSLIGFITEGGTEYLAPTKTYPIGEWTNEIVTFSLTESTIGYLTVGYQGQNIGQESAQHWFIDGVKLKTSNNTDVVFYEAIIGFATGGFLGSNSGSTVSNITATGQVAGTLFVGGICGLNQETVNYTNCKHTGDISGQQAVGGVLGKMESGSIANLTSCASKGIITNTGDYTGGVIALCDGGKIAGIESCSHFGDITGQNYIGGLIGTLLSVALPTIHTYTWRYGINSSYISETFYDTIEVGTSSESPINNSVAIGNITGNSYVGGLVGQDIPAYSYRYGAKNIYRQSFNSPHDYYLHMDGGYLGIYDNSNNQYSYSYALDIATLALTNNYYSGTIHGTGFVGGLAGQKSGGQITNNYSYASIFGSSNVGGIVGQITDDVNTTYNLYNQTTIKSNVANCAIMSATSANVGRIYGALENAEHVTIGALGSADGNRALTTAQVVCQGVTQDITDNLQNGNSIGPSLLRLKATYVAMGWDFDNNWDILETESFPYKTFQTAPPVIESDLVSQATSISGKSVDGGTVYLFYKDREAVETNCVENHWTFTTENLQSGAQVQIYAEVEGKTPSYFTTANVAFPGSGTEDDPYRIYTAEDLQGATKAAYYKLMNDIDLTSWIAENSPTTGWVAVGRNSGNGTYIDGGNHKITGLWINSNEDYTGLFSNYSSGRIKNLTVEVANGKKVKGGNYTGILVGRFANGQIENCIVTGDVEGTQYVGGVVGYVTNTPLSDLSYEGEVKTSTVNACVGGVAGYVNASNITNCYATTTVNATGNSSNVGGLVGQTVGGTISQTKAEANITATGTTDRVGGLVGNAQSIIEQSLSTGNVVASGDNSYTGGLVGLTQDHTVSNSYSTVVITGTEYSAGLIGYANNTAIDKCYAKGNIEGVMYGAGVVGELEAANATLTNSVALNNILALSAQSSWGSRVIGGYKNGAADPDESNYALATMQVSLNNVPQTKTDDLVEGIAKSEADLLTAATYINLGWDFSTVWSIDEGNACPKLQWEDGVTPPSFLVPGDANGDNTVNVTDYVCIANYILGQSTGFFDTTAADVNEDGSVNVSDYVGVANIILYGRYTGQAANSIKALSSESSSTWLEAQNGEDGQLTLQLHDAKAFVAFQMDIQLPEGVTIKEATMAKANQTPNLGVANLGNGTWRLLYGTLTNKDVKLNDGNLLTLQLTTNETYMGGSLVIDNIFLTKANTNTQQLDAILAGLPTGIRSIENGLATRTIYDLTGRKVEKMQRGIYIVNGKKVSVK